MNTYLTLGAAIVLEIVAGLLVINLFSKSETH